MTETRKDALNGIGQNAARLLSDAQYLRLGHRYASAFALALIAQEEMGKLIHERWKDMGIAPTRRRRTAHLRKQCAVACLILAGSIIPEIEGLVDANVVGENAVEALARIIANSKEARFHRHTELGIIDRTKQVALYRDDWPSEIGITAEGFDREDVQELFDQCKLVTSLLFSDQAMRVGQAIYDAAPHTPN